MDDTRTIGRRNTDKHTGYFCDYLTVWTRCDKIQHFATVASFVDDPFELKKYF